MKIIIFLMLSNVAMGKTVIDSLHVESSHFRSQSRELASSSKKFCIFDEQGNIFAQACYHSKELCKERLNYWSELPSEKKYKCEIDE